MVPFCMNALLSICPIQVLPISSIVKYNQTDHGIQIFLVLLLTIEILFLDLFQWEMTYSEQDNYGTLLQITQIKIIGWK